MSAPAEPSPALQQWVAEQQAREQLTELASHVTQVGSFMFCGRRVLSCVLGKVPC